MKQQKNPPKLRILTFFFSSFVYGDKSEVWGGVGGFKVGGGGMRVVERGADAS